MARDAYESDTGERDNPECHHFLTKTTVERRIALSGSAKRLNRRGRAIARIMYHRGWSFEAIGEIFGVAAKTIWRCVQVPPGTDEVENDYDYAGEEFREKFGPRVGREEQVKEESTDEERTSSKRKLESGAPSVNRRTVKKPRLSSSPLSSPEPESQAPKVPLPQRAKRSTGKPRPTAPAASLSAFLKYTLALEDVVDLTTPAHLALFEARGFTVPHLQAMAQWTEGEVSEALRRLLSNKVDDHIHLDVFEVVMLEVSMGRLRANAESATSSSPNIHTTPSLPAFLANVHSFNLSPHLPLFLAAGFTLDRLRALSGLTASLAVVYEALARSLQRGSSLVDSQTQMGLSPLEIIALEFALRAAALVGP
ncbi:hypothetical protein C8F01DRAFT_752192 [Mycena amicta]|nr:hypothetical protein C8F01DRAFT_752192 [Mycena amicta]